MMIEASSLNNLAASTGTSTTSCTVGEKDKAATPFGEVLLDHVASYDVFALMRPKTPNDGVGCPSALFSGPPAPTVESVFGEKPWMDSPAGSGPNGESWSYNPVYFATKQTAEKVAALVGGKVVEKNALTPYGPLQQGVANQMVELPNGRLINAGLFATLYTHGFNQTTLDRFIQIEINGA
jgi:hypothetical protein